MTPSDRHLKRLAVLDVEGIILPKRRYLLLHALNRVPFPTILLVFFYGFLYHFGLIPLDKARAQGQRNYDHCCHA